MALTLVHLQQREEHWAIVDLVGKGGHVRTVPVPDWVRTELDDWLTAAAIDRGKLFRRVNKVGRTWGEGMTVKAVWHIVRESARSIGADVPVKLVRISPCTPTFTFRFTHVTGYRSDRKSLRNGDFKKCAAENDLKRPGAPPLFGISPAQKVFGVARARFFSKSSMHTKTVLTRVQYESRCLIAGRNS